MRMRDASAGTLWRSSTVEFVIAGTSDVAEAEASGWSMPLVAQEWPGFETSSLRPLKKIGFRELFDHAEDGDAVAAAVRDRCLHVWAANVVSLAHAYDPEIVVLGGGVNAKRRTDCPLRSALYGSTYVVELGGKRR